MSPCGFYFRHIGRVNACSDGLCQIAEEGLILMFIEMRRLIVLDQQMDVAWIRGSYGGGQPNCVRIILPHTSLAKHADAGDISFAFKRISGRCSRRDQQ